MEKDTTPLQKVFQEKSLPPFGSDFRGGGGGNESKPHTADLTFYRLLLEVTAYKHQWGGGASKEDPTN